MRNERCVGQRGEPRARDPQPTLDVVLRIDGPEKRASHAVAACDWRARLALVHVRGDERGADRASGVARRRLQPHAVENATLQQLAVRDAV